MDLPLWDMPLWDPWDDQSYPMLSYDSNFPADHGWNADYSCQGLVTNQSSYYGKDHGQNDFNLRYRYDIIEEDALNEKCCIQVLKALNKEDEDILKLDEDILMLECQLDWDNEKLFEPCSVALNKRIDHLDDSIQSLKNEVNCEHNVTAELEEPGKVTQILHDVAKPLLENYVLVKSEKTGSSNMVVPTQPSEGTSNRTMEIDTSKLGKEVDAKKQVNQLRTNLSVEPKERKNNLPERGPIAEKAVVKNTEDKKTLSDLKSKGYQRTTENTSTLLSEPVMKAMTAKHKKGEDIISKIFKNAHQYAKEMNKLNKQTGKEVPKCAPTMSEKRSIITSEVPSIPIVKQDTNPSRTKKSDSRRRGLVGNSEVLSTVEVNRLKFAKDMNMLNIQTGKEVPKSAPMMSEKRSIITSKEPSIPIVKQDTNPSRTKKSDSRRRGLVGNSEVLCTVEVNRLKFAKDMNMLNIQTGKEVPKSATMMSEKRSIITSKEPSIPIVKQDTNPGKTKKSDSRGRGLEGNNEVLSTAEVDRLEFAKEMNTLNKQTGQEVPKFASMSRKRSIITPEDTNPGRTKKSDSRGRGLEGNNEVLSTAEVDRLKFAKEMDTLNKQTGQEVPKFASMSRKRSIITSEEPSISVVKQDTNPRRTKKSDLRSGLVGNSEVITTAEVKRLEYVHEIKTTNSYLKSQENVGEVIQPSMSIVEQDTNPSRRKKSYSRGSGLPINNEVLSSAEVPGLQVVQKIKTTNSCLKSQDNVGKVVQPSTSIVMQDTNPSRTNKSDSRWSDLVGNNEVLSTGEVCRLEFVHEIKRTYSYLESQEKVGEVVQPAYVINGEQMSEEITQTRKTRAYRHAINKDFFSKKPLAKKRKLTSFPERTDTLESRESEIAEFDDSVTLLELYNLKRKYPRKATEETTGKHQGQQIANNLVLKLENSNYHVKPDQGPENTYVRKQEIASVTYISEEILQGLSWTEKADASQVIHTLVSS